MYRSSHSYKQLSAHYNLHTSCINVFKPSSYIIISFKPYNPRYHTQPVLTIDTLVLQSYLWREGFILVESVWFQYCMVVALL